MKILTIGGTGLVGSRVNELLSQNFAIDNLSTKNGLDITKPETLSPLKEKDYQYLIIYAAKTNVDACEKDKNLGEKGEAYQINVTGVQNIVNTLRESNKELIYISTDFVFEGTNPPDNGYTEESQTNPINWYGQTKYFGEESIKISGLPYLIIRISYPYRSDNFPKKDFVRAILTRLQNNQQVSAVTDHILTPTYIDDIAGALHKLITTNAHGTYHVSGNQSLTPYDASLSIAKNFNLNDSLITKTTRDEFFKNGAPRPFNLTINNAKIRELGIKMKTFEEGLKEVSKNR
jgi:dTDP-4-dehydrorhamnose reductase